MRVANGQEDMKSNPDHDVSLQDVIKAEQAFIENRRKKLGIGNSSGKTTKKGSQKNPAALLEKSVKEGLTGLGLSGGGVRSASFNLGLLQFLGKRNLLRYFDYLSTVSGGGYIGSCLSSLLTSPHSSVLPENFPLGYDRVRGKERNEITHIRSNIDYLLPLKHRPGAILGIISQMAPGIILINLIPAAFVLFCAWVYLSIQRNFWDAQTINIVFSVCGIAFAGSIFFAIFRSRGVRWAFLPQQILTALSLGTLALGLFFLLMDLLRSKILTAYLGDNLLHIPVLLSPLAGLLAFLVKLDPDSLPGMIRNGVLKISLLLLGPLLFLQGLILLTENAWIAEQKSVLWLAALGLFALAIFVNLNRISLHYIYRNRLSQAFIIREDQGIVTHNDGLDLVKINEQPNGPYHLINATLNIPTSRENRYLHRGADFFLFSREHCGSVATGYTGTSSYARRVGGLKLATAMAISGAAASPEMGDAVRNPILSAVLTMLNVRLNLWLPNPTKNGIAIWPIALIREIFRLGKETNPFVNLSDGGHIENLGAYELLRRHCRCIVISDAGADPDYEFEDLANLVRKARIDLGVEINLDLSSLAPAKNKEEQSLSRSQFAIGSIEYKDKSSGHLIYIKAAVTEKEPPDILAYRRTHDEFPNETTADQFFDESQFESYRELGYRTAKALFGP